MSFAVIREGKNIGYCYRLRSYVFRHGNPCVRAVPTEAESARAAEFDRI